MTEEGLKNFKQLKDTLEKDFGIIIQLKESLTSVEIKVLGNYSLRDIQEFMEK